MLVQMPEIIYVSEFYVEQFIWTEIFYILSNCGFALTTVTACNLQVKTDLQMQSARSQTYCRPILDSSR